MAYKVRFHLARGPHYEFWQITDPEGNKTFHDPELYQINMTGIRLKNLPNQAQKIKDGESSKFVIASVICESVEVIETCKQTQDMILAYYNPHVHIHWLYDGNDADGWIADHAQTYLTRVYARDLRPS